MDGLPTARGSILTTPASALRWAGRVAPALLVSLALTAPAGAGPVDLFDPDLDPRELPSLVERWSCHCSPAAATVGQAPGGGAVYVQSYRRFFALDVATHDVLWDHEVDEAGRPVGAPLLLEDRLAVVYADRLLLVEPVSGVIVEEVELDGRIERAVGPPLTVELHRRSEDTGEIEGEVVRLDEATGRVLARRSLRLLDLAARDGRLLAVRLILPSPGPDEAAPNPRRLLEMAPDDLATVRSWPGGDRHFLESDPGPRGDELLVPFGRTDGGERFLRFEDLPVGDGQGAEALPPRPRKDFHDLSVHLQAELPTGPMERSALRRIDPDTGEVLWTRSVPHRPRAWLWDGGRLRVHTDPRRGGRGFLLELDPETGAVLEAAYGFAGVRSLARWEDLLIAVTDDEVVAFAADERGPPEARIRPVAREVGRLLERLEGRKAPYPDDDVARELEALGAEALPLLLDRLPALGPRAALTAASVFSAARYEPAAPRLVELLETFPEPPEDAPPEWTNARPEIRILTALGRIGGPEEVPAVGSLLLDDEAEEDLRVRERALTTLAEIGGPEVLPWIDRFWAARTQRREPGRVPPPAAGSEPSGEEQTIRWRVVRHFAAFRKQHLEGPLYVAAEPQLDWSDGGAGRPILPAPDEEEGGAAEGAYTLRVEPADEEAARAYRETHSELGPNERLWVVTATSGRFAEAHWVILRMVGGRWLVRRMTEWWIT